MRFIERLTGLLFTISGIMSRKKIIYGLSLLLALQVLLAQNANAYLDPGTGSYVFQVLIATLIGALFTIKMYWQKIKNSIVNLFTKKQEK
jgi:hypothetical protein